MRPTLRCHSFSMWYPIVLVLHFKDSKTGWGERCGMVGWGVSSFCPQTPLRRLWISKNKKYRMKAGRQKMVLNYKLFLKNVFLNTQDIRYSFNFMTILYNQFRFSLILGTLIKSELNTLLIYVHKQQYNANLRIQNKSNIIYFYLRWLMNMVCKIGGAYFGIE